MRTYEDEPSPLPGSAIQNGRTTFHEGLIDKKVQEIHDLTGEILRWPIPRPLLRQRLNRALGVLAWSGNELKDSVTQDQKAQAAIDVMARHMVAEASRITAEAASAMPELVGVSDVLDHDAAAETPIAIIDDSRLTGGNSTDLIA